MEFLIGFNPGNYPVDMSGGMTVIRKLAELLSNKNQKVYVLNPQLKVGNTILINDSQVSKLNKDKLVVIYPEITQGNPYNAKHVVRWILFHTNPQVEFTWSYDDVYFYYSDFFNTSRKEDKKFLNCYDFKLDKFKDKNLNRDGYCHIARKKAPLDYGLTEKFNSEDLFNGHASNGIDWLVDKFNEKKYFITYDDATFYSVIAALCGCISVVLYDKNKKEDLKKNMLTHKYGIAYGFEEVDESIQNRKLIRPNLENMISNSFKTINDFILFWENKLIKKK